MSKLLRPLQTLQKAIVPYGFYWSIEVYQYSERTYVQSPCSGAYFNPPKIPILIAQNLSPYYWSSVCWTEEENRVGPGYKIKEGLSIVRQKDMRRINLSIFCFAKPESFSPFVEDP